MKTIELPGTGLAATEIGFGCGGLVGMKTTVEAHALLEAAWEAGVRHFDVARYYGYGQTEGLLGDFLRTRKESFTVTTKFGLVNKAGVARFGGLIGMVRAFTRRSPWIRSLVRSRLRQTVETGRFSVQDAQGSLETSLRELKRDFVDIFLLHECLPADVTPELQAYLDDEVRQGRIRAYGLGTQFASTLEIEAAHPDFGRIAQFESTALNRHAERFRQASGKAFITHGTFNAFGPLHLHLQQDGQTAAAWREQLGLDVTDAAELAALLLASARRANPSGIVLFAASSPSRVAANCAAATDGRFSDDQLAAFEALVRGLPENLRPASSP